jgi:hypothetical protein
VCRCPTPDQDLPLLIYRQLFGVNQVFLECFQRVVIELQAEFEDAIGEALVLLEQRNDLIEDGVVVHHRPSTWASADSAWGSQKVISMA